MENWAPFKIHYIVKLYIKNIIAHTKALRLKKKKLGVYECAKVISVV